MSMVDRARQFATERHGEQKRKYTGEPYWHHLRNVAETVAGVTSDEGVIAAAWLHDVLEDTEATTAELKSLFGEEVSRMVLSLTDFATLSLNRKQRKAIDRDRLAASDARVQTVKLADLIDNTASIVAGDKNFARVYLDEKEALLAVLTKGDPALQQRAAETLQQGQLDLVRAALKK